MRTIFSILFFLSFPLGFAFNLEVYDRPIKLQIDTVEGYFLLESSTNLVSSNDLLYRERAFIPFFDSVNKLIKYYNQTQQYTYKIFKIKAAVFHVATDKTHYFNGKSFVDAIIPNYYIFDFINIRKVK